MRDAAPRRCDDVQVGEAVVGSLAILGLTTPDRRCSTKQVTAHGRAPGGSNAYGGSGS